jgi:hypothetical protein
MCIRSIMILCESRLKYKISLKKIFELSALLDFDGVQDFLDVTNGTEVISA